ncbi:hypothetical protein COB57_00450 [Candidatus Peregrinibacteria bacterium]|nr:MAG: hypothetical protein COB57_00450 [Candidatus Peregrinibacteria bacterium]
MSFDKDKRFSEAHKNETISDVLKEKGNFHSLLNEIINIERKQNVSVADIITMITEKNTPISIIKSLTEEDQEYCLSMILDHFQYFTLPQEEHNDISQTIFRNIKSDFPLALSQIIEKYSSNR